MDNFDAEYFYSLYNPENGVELYDSLVEAEKVKKRWSEVIPVDGPFQHSRPERDLILQAQRAMRALMTVCEKDRILAEKLQLNPIVTELRRTLDALITPPSPAP